MAGIGYVNLATLVWASNLVIGRMVRDDIGSLALSATIFSIAALILAPMLRKQAEPRPTKEALGLLAGMALFGVILFSPLLYLGLHYDSDQRSHNQWNRTVIDRTDGGDFYLRTDPPAVRTVAR